LSFVFSNAGGVLMHADNGRVDHLDGRIMSGSLWPGPHSARLTHAPRDGATAEAEQELIGFVLPDDNLYATSGSLTYLVSASRMASLTAKSISIKDAKRRPGDPARKATELTPACA
jgi:hypothetical protein